MTPAETFENTLALARDSMRRAEEQIARAERIAHTEGLHLEVVRPDNSRVGQWGTWSLASQRATLKQGVDKLGRLVAR